MNKKFNKNDTVKVHSTTYEEINGQIGVICYPIRDDGGYYYQVKINDKYYLLSGKGLTKV